MIRRIILALAVSLSVSHELFAQTQAPKPDASQTPAGADDVVRITTNLVQIDAVVLKNGKPVKDLKAEDFELFEDGRRQAITSFAYISNVSANPSAPKPRPDGLKSTPQVNPSVPHRTIALVVDDLGLTVESMHQVRKQIRKFIAEQVQPNDLIAVMRTGGTLGALQQFTNDRRITERAVNQLRWNICSRVGTHYFSPAGSIVGGSRSACGGKAWTRETLRALRFVVEAMGELPGRKSLVLFSDSVPREEQEEDLSGRDRSEDQGLTSVRGDYIDYNSMLYRIAEKAIRASVVIYAVDSAGLMPTGLMASDRLSGAGAGRANNEINQILSSRSRLIWDRREGADLIARQTGGFLVRNTNDFMLNRIMEEESGYYLLGYRPVEETFNKRFHRIKAKVKRSGMTLRTRHGFYGITEEEAAKIKRTSADQATIALMSPFGAQQIELALTAFFADEKDKGSFVRSFVHLQASDLKFEEDANGWQNANVQFRGIIFGDNGVLINEVSYDRLLSFKGEAFQKALRSGLAIQFDIPVKQPGSFQIRISARDISSGHIGSTGQFVEVPNLKNRHLALSGIVLQGVSGGSLEPNLDTAVGPAVRQFSTGQRVRFGCVIYNPALDRGGKPSVVMQARLFRDDKQVYDSPAMTISLDNQADFDRLVATGLVHLDPKLEPGNYYLQLTVADKLREKQEPVVQWIDFDIVKVTN